MPCSAGQVKKLNSRTNALECSPADSGTFTLQNPYRYGYDGNGIVEIWDPSESGSSSAVVDPVRSILPRAADMIGISNYPYSCPVGRVCGTGMGCLEITGESDDSAAGSSSDSESTACPPYCSTDLARALLPNKPGLLGSSACLRICNSARTGLDIAATFLNVRNPGGGAVLRKNFWRPLPPNRDMMLMEAAQISGG